LIGRDLTSPDSVTRSPLYSIYGETISGVTILRAFGASSKFLRDMLKSVDTVLSQTVSFLRKVSDCKYQNTSPFYWMWGGAHENARNLISSVFYDTCAVNRWLSVRFNLLSAAIVGLTAFVTIITPTIDAALAGFILAFATTVTMDVSVAFV
jgi:ABC-type multidrug transport system fused ATPase/permease subunit